jgi:hypothetical protein
MAILTTRADQYYANSGDHGNYRYISLAEIIDSFAATYVGPNKLCQNVLHMDINFHAIRALQELSYDTLKCTKDWEVEVPDALVLVTPIDYINYVKLSWTDGNGIQRIIYPTSKTSNPLDVNHTVTSEGAFDTSAFSADQDLTTDETSYTVDKFKNQSPVDLGSTDSDEVDDLYGHLKGQRYGIDPQYAQGNGTFFIDESAGKFHFSSNLAGKTLVLKYISDGLVTSGYGPDNGSIDLTASMVPKMAEEAIYKHILYGILSARRDTEPATLMLVKKEKFAETRKAKLRLSNIKLEELTQVLRGSSKIIKH